MNNHQWTVGNVGNAGDAGDVAACSSGAGESTAATAPLYAANERIAKSGKSATLGAVLGHFQSSFRAISEQLRFNFSGVLGQFQSKFSAISEHFESSSRANAEQFQSN